MSWLSLMLERRRRDKEPRGPLSEGAALAVLIFTMVIWASAFPTLRVLLRTLEAPTLTSIRMVIAALGLIGVGFLAGTKLPAREDMLRIGGAGLAGFSLYHLTLNLGLVHLTAGQGSFLVATMPVWTALLSWYFLGERLGPRGITGLLLGLAGVAVLSSEGLFSRNPELMWGASCVLMSAVAAGVNITLQKELLTRYKPLDISIHVTVAGALPFFFYLPLHAQQLLVLDGDQWAMLLYLGLVPISFGYVLSTIALAALPATRASQMLLLIPPIASLTAWIWLGERPDEKLWIGGPLILAGVLVTNMRRRVAQAQEAP
jgi:drug/metabolite transporter (DMT)-like permease